jgi:hypothetical protein
MRNLHVSYTLGCTGNWKSKDNDEVNKREGCECDDREHRAVEVEESTGRVRS